MMFVGAGDWVRSLVFGDDFNRANNASLGANWTESGDGNLAINTNELRRSSSGAGWARWNTGVGSEDQYSQITVQAGDTTMLFVRCNSGMTVGIEGGWSSGGGGVFSVRRGDPDSGPFTTLASVAAASPWPATLVLEIRGQEIRLFSNGVRVLDAIDATYTPNAANDYVAVRADAATHRSDNFAAGTIT